MEISPQFKDHSFVSEKSQKSTSFIIEIETESRTIKTKNNILDALGCEISFQKKHRR